MRRGRPPASPLTNELAPRVESPIGGTLWTVVFNILFLSHSVWEEIQQIRPISSWLASAASKTPYIRWNHMCCCPFLSPSTSFCPLIEPCCRQNPSSAKLHRRRLLFANFVAFSSPWVIAELRVWVKMWVISFLLSLTFYCGLNDVECVQGVAIRQSTLHAVLDRSSTLNRP